METKQPPVVLNHYLYSHQIIMKRIIAKKENATADDYGDHSDLSSYSIYAND